jgi:uncharacterized membrane protein YkgB
MLSVKNIDLQVIGWLRKAFLPLARVAIFIIYFYFGILKVFDLSPAGPLAHELTNRTIGAAHFHTAYLVLALFECLIGVLFLFPKLNRIVIPLLFIHVVVVCSPLLLLPQQAWTHPFVPSFEGQYIIKNVIIVALAIGIAAHTTPLAKKRH